MPEEQLQNTPEATLWERTRKTLLVSTMAISSILYGLSEEQDIPRSTHNLLDVQQHAAHLAPGIALGYGIKAVVEELPYKIRNYATAVSITSVAVIGSLFETQVSDFLWYRNTTKDVNDALYTAFAGIIGAYCIRRNRRRN